MPSPPGLPMTLGNMRELGIRSLAVTCELCHHEATLGDLARRHGEVWFPMGLILKKLL